MTLLGAYRSSDLLQETLSKRILYTTTGAVHWRSLGLTALVHCLWLDQDLVTAVGTA